MKAPLVDLLNEKVPHLIAWCTPSILHDQPRIKYFYRTEMSISYEPHGSPEDAPWSAKSGVFGEASRLAAAAYWGDAYDEKTCHCLFSVNGSSGSNFMILKALKLHFGRDLHILAQRNLHKSVIEACEDYGAKLTLLEPRYHPDYQIFMPNLIDEFIQRLEVVPSINVVILSNPTYDGFSLNLTELIRRIRAARDVIVFVDEAWGSNFYFDHLSQPKNALESGADIAILSTHKQGGAMQQTGIILWKDAPYMPPKEMIFHAYRSLLTTSPSWHLLATIDASRAYLQEHGEVAIGREIEIADYIADAMLNKLPRITQRDIISGGSADVGGMDRTKVLFYTGHAGIWGRRLASRLAEKHIIVEKSELDTILFLVPFQRTMQDARETVSALRDILPEKKKARAVSAPRIPTTFRKLKEPYEVGKLELVPLEHAAGRISGENITPYPPGIPLIIRGEELKPEHIEYIAALHRSGSTVLMYDAAAENVLVEEA